MNDFETRQHIEAYLREDGLDRHAQYWRRLPQHEVACHLKIKSDGRLVGLPFFAQVFECLQGAPLPSLQRLLENEGKAFHRGSELTFDLPLGLALSGERVALNLLQHASAVASLTQLFVQKAAPKGIAILDTRKTTPGLRWLEKYAVVMGGGQNHRWSQTDMWMIKDNHKAIMGGVKGAVEYFRSMGTYYTPILLEVHALSELREGLALGIRHFMLDNFSPADVAMAASLKTAGVTFEISGGITLQNIDQYLVAGIDAISIGSLTQHPARIDLSLKMSTEKGPWG